MQEVLEAVKNDQNKSNMGRGLLRRAMTGPQVMMFAWQALVRNVVKMVEEIRHFSAAAMWVLVSANTVVHLLSF